MNFEELKVYLPKFLSPESDNELFIEIKNFPDNLDSRLYTNYLLEEPFIYQGDGIKEMLVVNLPDEKIKPSPSIVLSNTCDIDINNDRFFPAQIVYAPIFNLDKYTNVLLNQSNKTREQIEQHIESIKSQNVTQIFYLPKLDGVLNESIVFLDRVINYPNKLIRRETLHQKRLFTLSNYGAYLFILKLSIHFTRIKDKVDRKSVNLK